MNMKWYVKLWWIILIVAGLSVALRGYFPQFLVEERPSKAVPKAVMVAPAPPVVTSSPTPPVRVEPESGVARVDSAIPHPVKITVTAIQTDVELIEDRVAAKVPEKSWVDYGDKIVGWLVALAGAYNLVKRPHTPAPVPVEKTTEELISGRKKTKTKLKSFDKPLELVPDNTKEQLAKRLAKQDPELTAAVLKDWIKPQ